MGIALVDRDQAQAKHPDWVITWPVSMVENLLLDSDAIWEVLEPHREATGLVARSAVAERLMEIARETTGRRDQASGETTLPNLAIAAGEVSIPEDSPELRSEVERLTAARSAWERGDPLPSSGEELREATVALARHAEGAGQAEVAARLRTSAASLAPQVTTAVAP